MVVNVGITDEQKMRIEGILESKKNKYRSTNNFVQVAVDGLMLKEKESETTKGDEEITTTLKKLDVLLDNLLEDELEEKIDLNNEILSSINLVSDGSIKLRNNISHGSDKRNILLVAINFRNRIDTLLSNLDETDGDEDNIIKRIKAIETIKENIIKAVKAIKNTHEI